MPLPTPSRRRPSITARDRSLLELLAEHRALVEPQLQRHLGVSPATAAARVRELGRAGLVGSSRIFDRLPRAVWITRRGLAAIGSELPPPRLDLKLYRHDIGVGWIWLAAADGAFGPPARIVSERAMRSHDRRYDHERALSGYGGSVEPGAPFGIGAGVLGPGGGEQRHYPDLLVELRDGHRVALELELTGKGRRRLDRIMLGYAAADALDAVLYLVGAGLLGRRVEEAARRAGIGDRVHVQALGPGSPAGAPEPPGAGRQRALERSASRVRVRRSPVEAER